MNCQDVMNKLPVAPLQPANPWQCVLIDFEGPFQSVLFLVASCGRILKVPQGFCYAQINSQQVIESVTVIFFLLMYSLSTSYPITDQFLSSEFDNFICQNGVKHICNVLYHPSKNEGFVQSSHKASLSSNR